MNRGFFITAEGTDGSGKSTQIKLITEYLKSLGMETVVFREPGGTRISEIIREIILDTNNCEMTSKTEMLLYAAARAQLVEQAVLPSLARGITVICDRYVDSTYAYQGFGRGLPLIELKQVNDIATSGTLPDLTLLFDLNAELAMARRTAAGATDRIENERAEFHTKVRMGYLQLVEAEPQRIQVIDSSGTVEEIWEMVKLKLENLLSQRCG